MSESVSLGVSPANVPSVAGLSVIDAGTRRSGRTAAISGIGVLASVPIGVSTGSSVELGEGRSIDELARLMVERMTAGGEPVRVALCIADASARPFWEAMEALLAERSNVVDLVRYRVGPSVGAFTGPGAAGGFWYGI